MKKFYDYIDKIIYINLDHRIDRKQEIEILFEKYEIPKEKIIRLSAVKHNKGNIGCYKSHINALELAMNNNYDNVLVLEDDFDFNYKKVELDVIFDDFFNLFKNKWKIFQLAWGNSKQVIKIKDTNFFKCIRGGCTAGYLVNNIFYLELLNNYKNGVIKLEEFDGITFGNSNINPYNIDMFWLSLQKETLFWITYLNINFVPIGKVTNSYSDIRIPFLINKKII